MTTTSTTFEVLDLDDPKVGDPSVAGTKAAGLARLRAASFRVPPGVVLPVGIAQAWPSGPAPEPLRAAVADRCARLGDALAVRTSATWEDGATSAHAGATATVLGVSGVDETLNAIRHCLDASAQAAREHGTSGDIAVVVQQLVPADWAGVAFSADPMTGDRDVVRIAATKGLGERLVHGDVVGSDITVRGQQVDGNLAGVPPELAVRVAETARDVEASFGRPQDVEWAAADDIIWLVQARPITALPTEPAPPEGNNWQKDTAHYPEPLTPFGWSIMHACETRSAVCSTRWDSSSEASRRCWSAARFTAEWSPPLDRPTAPANRRLPSCLASPLGSSPSSGAGTLRHAERWRSAASSTGSTTGTGATATRSPREPLGWPGSTSRRSMTKHWVPTSTTRSIWPATASGSTSGS